MNWKLLTILYCLLNLTACVSTFDDKNNIIFIDEISVSSNIDSNKLSFEEIKSPNLSKSFEHLKQNNLIEIGREQLTSWIKLKLNKNINPTENYILEIDRPTLDEVTVYLPQKNNKWKIIKTGDTLKFSSREIRHPNFVFDIPGSIKETADRFIYIRIKSKIPASFSLSLSEEINFYHIDSTNNLYKGLYFGVLFALIIFNLFIFFSVRDISYLWYVGYLSFITLFFLAYNGFTFQYLWPNSSFLANKMTFIALLISFASGLLFNRSILNIEEISPPLSSIMLWTALLIVLSVPTTLLIGSTVLAKITPIIAIIVLILSTHGIIKSVISGYAPAYFVAGAFSFLFLGGGIFALFKLGLLPAGTISQYGFELSVLIEAFLLSFALAYKINYTNKLLKVSNQKVLLERKLFSSQLIEFQDNERKKVASELHDSLGQKLMVLKIQLSQFIQSLKIKEDDSRIISAMGLLQETVSDVRNISHHLHPHQLERLTLDEALEDIISQSFKASNINIHCDLEALKDCKVQSIQLHIYRIVQESIKNILTHAHPKNIEFTASSINNKITLIIKDDGKGIDAEWFNSKNYSKAFGLSSIKERVESLDGSLILTSEKDGGFKITILFDYDYNDL